MTRSTPFRPSHPASARTAVAGDIVQPRLIGALMLGAALALLPLTGFAQTAAPEAAPDAAATAAPDAAPATTMPAPDATPPVASPSGTPTPSPVTETAPAPEAKPAAAQAAAVVRGADGAEHGSVTISDTPSGALHLILHLSAIPDGPHAIHIHETGKCDPPAFESAGGHLTGGKEHGAMAAGGMHSGDLPNIDTAEGGSVNQELFLPGVTLAEVMDADGAAFVMHAGVDDYISQPSGNAGDRIACGVFE